MRYDINLIVNGDYITTFYDINAESEAEAVEQAEQRVEIDFEVEPYE